MNKKKISVFMNEYRQTVLPSGIFQPEIRHHSNRAFLSYCVLILLFTVTSCTSSKTPYVSDAREPNDLPPSPSYRVVWMALRDELPRHGTKDEFYLCQGPEQLAALQRDLPDFTLRHASETYTTPVKDWPGIVWSRRRSDDALATRVTIDIDTATDDTITTTLSIGHQAPNLTLVCHTFRRTGSTWKLVKREEGPEIQI